MASVLDYLEPEIIQEPLTNRIRVILDEYPDGTQIARELLQNSDDARSKVQWYLLDHRNHVKHARTINPTNNTQPLQLIHKDFHKYMGPALLAGSDSIFEKKDFVSLRNLASSEKRTDESKIGQMGIGFNSIYHLTDCPSFITGDQFMVIDPHLSMFKNHAPAMRGPLSVLDGAPDQLRAFSVLEEIDCAKPYQGTIFRFPLRTNEQVPDSKISDYAYTPAKVLEMLEKLKDEALKALLFLKHVEKIIIYERKEDQDEASTLFEIEIVNAEEVRKERRDLINNLKAHVNPDQSASEEDVLQYSVRPTYRITQKDGPTTEETWHITTLVGNVIKSREYMKARTDGNLNSHKLIPWVGIAAPVDPNVKIDASRLFCFLPMGIQLPFPVHINGHFAVKQSRREIWTNQDNDFSSQAAANIKSLWNVHLFGKQVPEAYAMFLENVGLDHGANYDLWPTSGGEGIGLEGIWKDLLKDVLRSVLTQDRRVFICGSKAKNNYNLRQYSTLYIAGRDTDGFPLLKEALRSLVNLAEDIPNVILREIGRLIPALGLDEVILTPAHVRDILFENKERWESTADSATRMEMLKYCLLDSNIADLEGLPLLPLDGDIWVDFAQSKAHERFLVPRAVFETLSQANAGLVDLNMEDYPFDQIAALFNKVMFWTPLATSSIVKRIIWIFRRTCYQGAEIPAGCITQSPGRFPSDEWIMDFWDMAHELADCNELISGLAWIHLLPVGGCRLAPLSTKQSAICLNRLTFGDVSVMEKVCSILEHRLDCNVLRSWFLPPTSLQQFVVDISDAPGILDLLSRTTTDQFACISQQDRAHLANYMAMFLQPSAKITEDQRRVLRCLPIYKRYNTSDLEPLDSSEALTPTTTAKQRRLARGYNQSEHPWLPQSIDLFADDQPMREHLRVMLSVSVLPESEYWHVLVSTLARRSESDWDAIMTKLAPSYHVHCKVFDLASVLRKIPFVLTTTASGNQSKDSNHTPSSRLSPESVVHPNLSAYFQDKDSVFPTGIYCLAPLFGLLSELGMSSTFDTAFVQRRLTTLFGSGGLPMEENRKMVEALYGRLNSECSERFVSPGLRAVIVAIPWVYTGPDSGWRSPAHCRPRKDRVLIGDKMPLAEFAFTNDALLGCMGWKSVPPLKIVLDNLFSIIDRHTNQRTADAASSPEPSDQKKNHASIDSIDVRPIYQYLSDKIKDSTTLKYVREKLQDKPWVLVSGTFYTVDRVALKMHCDLHPHFVQLPTSNLNDFYLELGVREHVRQEDMEGIISTVASKYPDGASLSQVDADLVYRLLTAIANGQNPRWSADLLLLTETGGLKRAAEVVYDDVNVRQSDLGTDELPYTFAHRRISHEMAERLSIVMFSERCWQDTKDNSFDPFFQQENIVDRIKGILNDYDPSSIFNEFLQNAADAGATECRFWLDLRSYGTKKVLSKQMAAWQGPALMIYNDAEFSDKDFDALCRLGVGNKKEDTSKIGRHGLGFNSVYHFTDVPSIVSGPYIGFLDPHMINLPKSRDRNGTPVAKGGHRCDFRKLSMETLGDQLDPYKGILGCNMRSHFKGTLFRLPLRIMSTEASAPEGTEVSIAATVAGSGFGDVGWTVTRIQRMMEEWIEDAKVGLLFLKNVKSIRISDGFKPQVTVVKTESRGNKPGYNIMGPIFPDLFLPPAPLVDIKTFCGESTTTLQDSSQWMVLSEEGFLPMTSKRVHEVATRNHWSPKRGIAILIQNIKFQPLVHGHRLFVHLPTPITTDLPFHVHGEFALTSNRKNLAGGHEEENDKRIWNSYLIEVCLPATAILGFRYLFDVLFCDPERIGYQLSGGEKTMALYFDRWPIKAANGFEPFLKAFLRETWTKDVFPRRGLLSDFPMRPISGTHAILPGLIPIPQVLQARVNPWLAAGSKEVSMVPVRVLAVILAAWKAEPKLQPSHINADFIRRRIRDTPSFMEQMVSKEDREWILGWALQPILNNKIRVRASVTSDDLAVIPLLNGQWKRLTGDGIYYIASRHERGLLVNKDMLVDDEVFRTKELEKALKILLRDKMYGVQRLPEALFAHMFLQENPQGITDDQREKLWDYLQDEYDGLEHFAQFPILRTRYGSWMELGKARTGFKLGEMQREMNSTMVDVLLPLLCELGIAVFEPHMNRSHIYFSEHCPKYTPVRILTAIELHWRNQATARAFTVQEAEKLRELIAGCQNVIQQDMAQKLGRLPLWTTHYSSSTSVAAPLIPAKGALYLDGHFTMDHLGSYPTLLREPRIRIFASMGATLLKADVAMKRHVLPKLQSGEIKCEGSARAAYYGIIARLIITMHNKKVKGWKAARDILEHSRCFLARDGSFRKFSGLIAPNCDLTEIVFADHQELFPTGEIAAYISNWGLFGGLRTLSSSAALVMECAEKVLVETVDAVADPATTRAKAVRLVKYIYENPGAGGVDWMDAKWKFVPRETNLEPPYHIMAPNLPVYMAFSALVSLSHRDYTWTQCGFFPANLVPSDAFKARYPTVHTKSVALEDIFKHLNVLVKDIAPLWKSTEEQLTLKAHLFKIYNTLERYSGGSQANRERSTKHSTLHLKVPYVLNGNDKDPSKTRSWIWAAQLMFDIDNNIPSHQVVDPVLRQYRTFLVAAGAAEMVHVEGTVQVADGRARGDMEDQIMNCFETQDQQTGFMDVRFKFEEGSDILAHKFVLARASQFFFRRFTGVWASNSTRDPKEPGIEIVDLSGYGNIRNRFWGLLYYFYSDSLIQSNGLPVLEYEKEVGESTVAEESDSDAEGEWEDRQKTPVEDKLAQRVQYLMELQDIANRFEVSRLKDLIAQELIMGQKVIHSNVFSIRGHAEHNQAENVREHCDLFIEKNKASVIKYVEGEIRVLRDELEKLDRKEEADEDDEDDDYEPSELSDDEEEDGDTEESIEELLEGEDDGHRDSEDGEGVEESEDESDEDEAFTKPSGRNEEETVEEVTRKLRDVAVGQNDRGGQANDSDSQWEEEESAEWTSGEDNLESDGSSSSEGEESAEEKVDAIGYLNRVSPLRASLEEDLQELEENLKELLAKP